MRHFVIAVIVLFGFVRSAVALRGPRAEGRGDHIAEEDDIREVVFRYEFRHNSSILGSRAAVYCLSLGEKSADPSLEFLSRFTGLKPPVRRVSDCRADPNKGVVEKRTGKRGLIFRVRKIEWLSETSVEVVGGYFEDGLSASGDTYRVGKKQGKWTVTKASTNWIS